MAVRAAVLELRRRATILKSRLKELADGAARVGGGRVHCLVERVDKSTEDALGWVKAMRKAVRRAARRGTRLAEVREALTEAQHHLDQLRRKEPRHLRSRVLPKDLGELCTRAERDVLLKGVGTWAGDAVSKVRLVCTALRSVDEAMAACWRELAAGATDRRVVVTIVE